MVLGQKILKVLKRRLFGISKTVAKRTIAGGRFFVVRDFADSRKNSMQKGDDDQQPHSLTSEEISEYSATTSCFNEAPNTSIVSCNDGPNYTDIVKVLSQVELPSPSPVMATSCTLTREENLISFHQGQSSGTKKFDETKGNVEQEKEPKDKQENLQESGIQFVAPQTHGHESNRRGRSRIHERIRVLKELIPNCNKRSQASILDDAIEYIKLLQMQVQMMQYMGAGTMQPGLYMSPGRYQSFQGPYLAPYFTMRPMIGTGYSAGNYGDYFNSSFPTFPPFISGFNPLVQPMGLGTGSPRLLPIPHLQFPTQRSEPVYSTTLSSDTIIPTTGSKVESGISSQSSYHIPLTSQQTQVSSGDVKACSSKSFTDGKEDA